MDYKILLGDAATPQDFDILLMVESKNMAALDGVHKKTDPIARKIEGTPDQQLATQTKRLEIREIHGQQEHARNYAEVIPAARAFRSLCSVIVSDESPHRVITRQASGSDCNCRLPFGLAIPQPTEWQHIRNQIDAALIFARADFVKKKLYVIRSYP